MSKISSGSLTIVDVKGGSDGINTATIYLYQRGTSASSKPTTNLTYTFVTAELTGELGNWTQDIGTLTGSDPIWVIAAIASSNGTTDIIEPTEWSEPIKMAQNGQPGEPGQPGAKGLNQATVFIYKRDDTATKPNSVTYTFATGSFTVPTGWSTSISQSNGKPCWVCSAVAIGSNDTAQLNWTNPVVLVEDGSNGSDGISPTVTATDNGVKIVDAEGNETFITNGSDGKSYYTHIRYSKNADGSNYVTTPTSDTVYVGIYSGLSSTAPPYNDNGWTWSRYVGQKGEDGQSATQYYAFVKYATDDVGTDMQDSPAEGYNYVGTYAGQLANPTASDFQWSKYVGEDGQQGQPGESAIQYYAFVRYATDSSGAGMTETPTANTIYVGTYTGQLANPTAQDYKWSKYVGADGNDGDDGVSVTGIKEVYFLTTGAAPAQSTLPNGTEIISTSTASDQWTTVVPTYIVGGKYYTSIQTNLDKGTSPIFSNIVLNQGLTDANKNASEAIDIARGVRQHFFWFPEDVSEGIPSGAYVAEENESTFKNGPTKGNILTRSDGIWIRNGVDKLATLQGSGLTFLVPTGTYKGQKSVSLNGSGLTFYNIGSSNSAAATLASDGLQITNGSIILGTTSGTAVGNVTLSNKNFERSINGTNHDDLRFAIGSKFGVASDGTLYASGANIQGQVTITAGSNVYTKDEVDDAVGDTATDLANYILSNDKAIEDLEKQIDGAIDTWYYAVDPTTSNEPAKDWTTEALKESHLRDLYFNTSNGHTWRWAKDGSTYKWIQIQDADAIKALADAAEAQSTANVKRRVFVTTPTPPYDVGDLWVGGSKGDIKKCKTAKAEGQSYAASDWELASKYTDDSSLNDYKTEVSNTYSTKVEVQQTESTLEGKITAAETSTKSYADGLIEQEVSDRNTAIQASADGITTSVSQNYTKTVDLANTDAVKAAKKAGTDAQSALNTYKTTNDAAVAAAKKAGDDAQADLDDYKDTVQETYATKTQLTQTESSIKSEVSSTYATKSSVPTKVSQLTNDSKYATQTQAQGYASTAESNAKADATTKANAAEANAKADATTKANAAEANAKADTTEKLKSYSTTTQMNSAIEQKANSIALSVAQTEISKIEVGGRNLLITDNFIATCLNTTTGLPSRPSASKSTKSNNSDASTKDPVAVDGDTHYTLSLCDDRPDASTQYGRVSWFDADMNLLRIDNNPKIDWTVPTSYTYTSPVNAHYCHVGIVAFPKYRWKFEKGNKATDWTPAPEDLEAYTDTQVSSAKAEIKVTTDNISSEVSKKVGNSEIISKINQSAETVQIEAEKVEFKGSVVFNAIKSQTDAAYDAKGSASAVQTNLDNLEIGGRNLALNSKELNIVTSVTNRCAGVYPSGDPVTIEGIDFAVSKASSAWRGIGVYLNEINPKVGDTFYYSTELYTDGAMNISIFLMCFNSSGSRVYPATVKIDGTARTSKVLISNQTVSIPKRIGASFILGTEEIELISGGGRIEATFQASNISSGSSAYMYAPKLEFGNKATDWTPAPEDVDASIEDVADSAAESLVSTTDAIYQRINSTDDEVATIQTNLAKYVNRTELNEVDAFVKKYLGDKGYVKVNNQGLVITQGQFSVVITGDRMIFQENGNSVAYLTNQKLFITKSEVTQEMKIANFVWSNRNGRLTLMLAE